jgi:hypothetical protein
MTGWGGRRRTPEAVARRPVLLDVDWETHLRDSGGDTSALSFMSGLGLGSIIGVIVAILLAPQTGREIRQQVRHTGIELRGRVPHLHADTPDSDIGETLADEAEHAEIELMRRAADRGDEG